MPKATLQEKQIADYLHGTVQSNSGGTKFGGGDVHTEEFLIECKSHINERDTFVIHRSWLKKLKEQAFEQGKTRCALAIRYEEDGEDYFIIPRMYMKEYVNLLRSVPI